MRVIGYVRVSTEEQAGAGHSLAAQEHRLRLYCELHGHELVRVVSDPGKSAKNLDREGLQEALEVLRAEGAEALLVVRLDRLSRDVGDMASLVREFFTERGGCVLLSVTDHVDTSTAAGRFALNVRMAAAQFEREMTIERTTEVIRHKRATGKVYGSTPLGYTRRAVDPARPQDDTLVPDEAEQQTLTVVRELMGTHSLREIAAYLAEHGHATKRGGRWQAWTVARLVERLERENAQPGARATPSAR